MEENAKSVFVAGIDVAVNRFEGELFVVGQGGEFVSVGMPRIGFSTPRFMPPYDGFGCRSMIRAQVERPWLRQKNGRGAQR